MASLLEKWVCGEKVTDYDEKGNKIGEHTCTNKAEDARDYIEIDIILSGCGQVPAAVGRAEPIKKQINACFDSITTDDLSIDGVGIKKLTDNCMNEIDENLGDIVSHIGHVRERAIAAFNRLQQRFNDEAKARCKH